MSKQKTINSQLDNKHTYQMYLRQMLALAENVFSFKNLPEFIDVAYMNKVLTREGAIAFFKDDVLETVTCLPFSSIDKRDMFGRPTAITVNGDDNYRLTLNKGEFVIMYDNNGKYALYLDICQMAERIALAVRTADVNVYQQRTPRFWKTTKDSEESLKHALNDVDSLVEKVVTYDTISFDNDNGVLAPAPYVTDKLHAHLDKLWAEFYRLIGVSNLQEQKRERVIVDEMVASQGGTIASRYSRFEPRKRAIEEINKKWGLNIEVQYYDGEPSTTDDPFVNNNNDEKEELISDVSLSND